MMCGLDPPGSRRYPAAVPADRGRSDRAPRPGARAAACASAAASCATEWPVSAANATSRICAEPCRPACCPRAAARSAFACPGSSASSRFPRDARAAAIAATRASSVGALLRARRGEPGRPASRSTCRQPRPRAPAPPRCDRPLPLAPRWSPPPRWRAPCPTSRMCSWPTDPRSVWLYQLNPRKLGVNKPLSLSRCRVAWALASRCAPTAAAVTRTDSRALIKRACARPVSGCQAARGSTSLIERRILVSLPPCRHRPAGHPR